MSEEEVLVFSPRPRRLRRRKPSWLAREILALAIVVGLPSGIVLSVFLLSSFRLREVVVEGARPAVARQLRSLAHPLMGENLLSLPLEQAAKIFHRNPWIDRVDLQKEMPNRLRVTVVERRPSGLLTIGGSLVFVDTQGMAIAPVSPTDDVSDLPVLSCATRCSGLEIARAFRVPRAIRRALPEAAMDLGPLEHLGEGYVRVRSGGLPFAILLKADQAEPQLRKLGPVLPDILRQYRRLEAVDLRFDGEIILQPEDAS